MSKEPAKLDNIEVSKLHEQVATENELNKLARVDEVRIKQNFFVP